MTKTYTYWYTIEKLVYNSGNCTKAVIKYYGDCVYDERFNPVRYAEFLDINFNPVKPVIGVDITKELTESWINVELTDEFINPVKERLKLKLDRGVDVSIAEKARIEAAINKDRLPWENTNPEND
tara:strand:- start:862 stop:1236 length:375 start_codon:yes stop_codon:yes gene_type:complete